MARTQVLKCLTPKFHQSYKSYGGIGEEEHKRRTPNSPRTRSKGFPSLRGEIDWWNGRSRSPLSFSSKEARIMGEKERTQAPRG